MQERLQVPHGQIKERGDSPAGTFCTGTSSADACEARRYEDLNAKGERA